MISGIFTIAYNQCASPEKGVNGFKSTGIYPLNRNIFFELYNDSKESDASIQKKAEDNVSNNIQELELPVHNISNPSGKIILELGKAIASCSLDSQENIEIHNGMNNFYA